MFINKNIPKPRVKVLNNIGKRISDEIKINLSSYDISGAGIIYYLRGENRVMSNNYVSLLKCNSLNI